MKLKPVAVVGVDSALRVKIPESELVVVEVGLVMATPEPVGHEA